MSHGGTLARRLTVLISAGFALIWALAVLASVVVIGSEQEELLDLELRDTAAFLHPILSKAYRQGLVEEGASLPQTLIEDTTDPEDAMVFAIVDAEGTVLVASPAAGEDTLPSRPPIAGYGRTATYAVFTTEPDAYGISLHFGDSLEERREAYLESFVAFLVPMLAILPLAYLLVGRIARTALRPLGALAGEIEQRGDARLDPIDVGGQPEELQAITSKLNQFMIRLSQALEGERAFATNAAHELRSPVAVALAQVQRLRMETAEPGALDWIDRLEAALKRMSRLVARLLQLARADAGIGPAETPQDVAQLLRLVLDETATGRCRAGRLELDLPDGPVVSAIDPDAFAIVVGNLVENALQHAPPETRVSIRLSSDGNISVTNEGPAIDPDEIQHLTDRFRRHGSAESGLGLGLYISERIARQSGGRIVLRSPPEGRRSGFQAVFRLPA